MACSLAVGGQLGSQRSMSQRHPFLVKCNCVLVEPHPSESEAGCVNRSVGHLTTKKCNENYCKVLSHSLSLLSVIQETVEFNCETESAGSTIFSSFIILSSL